MNNLFAIWTIFSVIVYIFGFVEIRLSKKDRKIRWYLFAIDMILLVLLIIYKVKGG